MTEARVEAIAEFWGTPEKERKYEPDHVASLLGVSVATVRRGKFDKRVKAAVKEALDNKLLYDVVEARSVLMKIVRDDKAKEDTLLKAIRTVEQLAGNLSGNGPVINVTNDFSTYGDMPTDQLMNEARRMFKDDLGES